MESIEYKYAKRKVFPLSLALLIPGIYFIYLIIVSPPEFALLFFLFIFFVFVFLPLNLIIISFTKPLHLRVSKDAIIDDTSLISYGIIPWRYIKSVTFGGSGHFRDWNNYLNVYMTEPTAVLLKKNENVIKTMILKWRYRSDKKVMIALTLLNIPSSDIEKEIRRFILEKNIVLGKN